MNTPSQKNAHSCGFPRSHRLSGKLSFSAVYDARVRESAGPLTVYGKPNDLPHSRIGLSIPRRVGTAPRRNRIKRLLREAFRLTQHERPTGYDLIIVVRPHEPLSLAEYQQILLTTTAKLHEKWIARKQSELK
jgi:ribonuclease P protein component